MEWVGNHAFHSHAFYFLSRLFSIILKGCDDDAVEDCAETRKTKKKAWASGPALGYFYMVSTCRARSIWGIYRFHLIFSTSDCCGNKMKFRCHNQI
ncbi:hypothetical protein EV2_039054 [Malus domestica]